ncbi:hypothetical protein BDQ17DRAFT_987110 [Cyathus striatus]|nr:hypothetical protein BDQ17DRAFT_987110 [Cyathus striatus]
MSHSLTKAFSKHTHHHGLPFKDYLFTNYAPSTTEISDIHQLVDGARGLCHQLSAVDNELSRLQAQMDKFQRDRDMLSQAIVEHRALLSPARQLPQDVLQEIFVACLPTDRNPSMSALEAPMLLTRICSAWRQIAFATPQLWARIHIVLPITIISNSEDKSKEDELKVTSKLQERERGVKEWLARSGACPLSISIYEAFTSYPYPEGDFLIACDLSHMTFINHTIAEYSKR